MGSQKVKMSEAITGDDLLDPEYVDLVRSELITRFAETYPDAEQRSISVSTSKGLDDDGAVFTVEGTLK